MFGRDGRGFPSLLPSFPPPLRHSYSYITSTNRSEYTGSYTILSYLILYYTILY